MARQAISGDLEVLAESGAVALARRGRQGFVLQLPHMTIDLSPDDLVEMMAVCLSAASRTGHVTVHAEPKP